MSSEKNVPVPEWAKNYECEAGPLKNSREFLTMCRDLQNLEEELSRAQRKIGDLMQPLPGDGEPEALHKLMQSWAEERRKEKDELRRLKERVRALTVITDHARLFPIQGGRDVPWRLIQPSAQQAERNHGQTLERLAERGGLAPIEALWAVKGEKWGTRHQDAGAEWEQWVRDALASERTAAWAPATAWKHGFTAGREFQQRVEYALENDDLHLPEEPPNPYLEAQRE